MILVVVYVGAVAVLFLFVVMMLDVDFAELKQGFLQYLPVGALIGLIVLVELIAVVGDWTLVAGSARRDRHADRRAICRTPRRSAGCSTRNMSISSRPPGSCCWSR